MGGPLRIGMVGCGFMGRAHSNAYLRVPNFFPDLARRPVLQAACGRDVQKLRAFADTWGFAAVEADWRRLVARDDVDAVDLCVPNDLHAEIAVEALRRGKMVLCEKPLARTLPEAEAMAEAARAAAVPTMVWYNYRRVPAVSLAKRLLDEGRVGRVFHYRAGFLQDWIMSPDVPVGGPGTWRLDVAAAGSGVTGDLLAHCFDTARWLNGPIVRVCAETETFVRERTRRATGEREPVGVDDACMVMARFANGAMGLFESTRFARGHKALKTFEVNGEDGSLAFDLHDSQWLDFYEYRRPGRGGAKVDGEVAGWRRIHVTGAEHPYMDRWWVPGLGIGYEHSFVHAVADFLRGLEAGEPAQPDFAEALETERVCAAVLRSAREGRWVEVASGVAGDSGGA
ncbi:MAG TPA: Gfo/Idh/MocA family oxidoreductase [Geminicoccaceae bacterium]